MVRNAIDLSVEILDIVRSDPIGSLFYADSGEIRFEPGMGLEELLEAWPQLAKRIVVV
jgi:hypothetical protein